MDARSTVLESAGRRLIRAIDGRVVRHLARLDKPRVVILPSFTGPRGLVLLKQRLAARRERRDAGSMTLQDMRSDLNEGVLSQVFQVSPPPIRARFSPQIVDIDDAKGAHCRQRPDFGPAERIAAVVAPDAFARVSLRQIQLAHERVTAFARRRLAGTLR